MSFRDSLPVLRRQLVVVVAGVVIGVGVGWVSAPGETVGETTFVATHTLLSKPQPGSHVYQHVGGVGHFALLIRTGPVPSRVAARFGMDGGSLRSAVSAAYDLGMSTVSITARSRQADRATALATATAEELIAEVARLTQAAFQTEVDRLTSQVASARARLNTAQAAAAARTATAAAGVAAAQSDLVSAERALQQYESAGVPPSQLRTLEVPVAAPFSPDGVQAPHSEPIRALLLGGFGLFLGVGAAFALERFTTRIRTKAAAEAGFGAPVVTEVPSIPRSSQGRLLTGEPLSLFLEAYRGLRTYVALWGTEAGGGGGRRVIVVTSPGPGEGKTTTVAHLAAMLGEAGRSVVVVSADLRRPQLHLYFNRAQEPGLNDVLRGAPDARRLADLNLATTVRGVRFVASGAPLRNPAPLLDHVGTYMRDARSLGDFVLVDSPPLLLANDAVQLASHADGVLLVARAGRTPVKAAQRSAELLERLNIPVVGAVLVASDMAPSALRYFRSGCHTEPERKGWRRRRSAGDNPTTGTPTAPSETPPAVRRP